MQNLIASSKIACYPRVPLFPKQEQQPSLLTTPKRPECLELRNQEKGVLAKGVSAESSVTPKETKIPKDTGPSTTFGTQRATAKRGVYPCKNPPSKNPLASVPHELRLLFVVGVALWTWDQS